MKTGETGKLGEDAACAYLEKKGYRIVSRNYHSKDGEVDIISTLGAYLVFTEVKTRKQNTLVSGFEAVDERKRRKIYLTAVKYMAENETDLQPRFDVIVVTPKNGRMETEHIENAFGAEVCDEIF